jgi:hypothetical protein
LECGADHFDRVDDAHADEVAPGSVAALLPKSALPSFALFTMMSLRSLHFEQFGGGDAELQFLWNRYFFIASDLSAIDGIDDKSNGALNSRPVSRTENQDAYPPTFEILLVRKISISRDQ